MKGVFFMDKTGLKIFVFINDMIFAFVTFVKNTPLWEKNASKVWTNILQLSHLFFWMMQAAFFFICPKLNWPLFHLSGIFACRKKNGQVKISIWNIWILRKWEAKFRNPLWHSSHCSYSIVQWKRKDKFSVYFSSF